MAVMAVPTMKPLTAILRLVRWAGRLRVPPAGAYSAPAGWRSAVEGCLEPSLDLRPFFGDDAEVRGMADRAVRHDHVVAEDPFECGADTRQRGSGAIVPPVRLELDAIGPEGLERVGQLEQLGLAIQARPLEGRADPRPADLEAAMLRHDGQEA